MFARQVLLLCEPLLQLLCAQFEFFPTVQCGTSAVLRAWSVDPGGGGLSKTLGLVSKVKASLSCDLAVAVAPFALVQ
jgi:hypothetical protein